MFVTNVLNMVFWYIADLAWVTLLWHFRETAPTFNEHSILKRAQLHDSCKGCVCELYQISCKESNQAQQNLNISMEVVNMYI